MKLEKASLGIRFLAHWIDSMIISLIAIPLLVLNPFLFFVYPITAFLYYGILEGCMGATLGKKLFAIKVVTQSGAEISAGTGFVRSISRLLSESILGIGFIIALFRDDGLALHDLMAGTFVTTAKTTVAVKPSTGRVTVVGLSGQFAGRSFDVPENGLIFGRDGAVCSVVYADGAPGISGTHCKLSYSAQTNMFLLQDLGSTYGTFTHNGSKVGHQPIALDNGTQFYLGSTQNMFRVMAE